MEKHALSDVEKYTQIEPNPEFYTLWKYFLKINGKIRILFQGKKKNYSRENLSPAHHYFKLG